MPSWQARLLVNPTLRLTVKRRLQRIHEVSNRDIRWSRRRLAVLSRQLPLTYGGVTQERVDAGGVPGTWFVASNADQARTILYLHGGGYAVGSADVYREFAQRLSRATRARVLVIDYRLAPEHKFPAPVEDANRTWDWLLATGTRPETSAIAGDSAGGGLCLAALLSIRDRGRPRPAAAVCLSPWTDLTASGVSLRTNADHDPFLEPHVIRQGADIYLDGARADNPLASPLFGDLRGLPPLMLHVGSTEILLSDSTRFAERARAAGVDVNLRVWGQMPHVFPIFARVLPEGRAALREIGAFVRARLDVNAKQSSANASQLR